MNDEITEKLRALSDSAKNILLKEFTFDMHGDMQSFFSKTKFVPNENKLVFEDLLLDEKFIKWYLAYEEELPQLIQDREKGIFHSMMFYCIEGVAPLVGPLDQTAMRFTWQTVENGKVTKCVGPVCDDCTCGYK